MRSAGVDHWDGWTPFSTQDIDNGLSLLIRNGLNPALASQMRRKGGPNEGENSGGGCCGDGRRAGARAGARARTRARSRPTPGPADDQGATTAPTKETARPNQGHAQQPARRTWWCFGTLAPWVLVLRSNYGYPPTAPAPPNQQHACLRARPQGDHTHAASGQVQT